MPAYAPIETQRLILRLYTLDEYKEIFRRNTDRELVKLFGFITGRMLDDQKAKLAGGITNYRTRVLFCYLALKSDDRVIGNFAFHNWYPMHHRSEIGYSMLAEEYKNKGYMREALKPLLCFGFEKLDLNRLEAVIHPDNTASRRLVEGMGFTLEGLLKEHYYNEGVIEDSLIYRLLKKEFQTQVRSV